MQKYNLCYVLYVNHARKCYALKMQIGGRSTYMQKLGVLCAICRTLGAM